MTLQSIRDSIDQLDQHLLDLLNERMRLVAEIGKLKRERGQSVFAPEREEMLLQALEKANSGPLGRIGLRAIYREILSASRANQSKLRIVYLGKENSTDFLAARMRFGASDCYRAEPNWKGAIRSLENNEADVAVVPRSILCQALSKKPGEKPFTQALRVCGEIKLVREAAVPETAPVSQRNSLVGDQFFMLTNGGEIKDPTGKSLLFLRIPGLEKLDGEFKDLVARFGGSVQSVEPVLASGERFFCEVIGTLQREKLLEEASRQWGRQAHLVLLGTYPTPHIYG